MTWPLNQNPDSECLTIFHIQTDVKGIVKGFFNGVIDNDETVISRKHSQLEENKLE